MLLQPEHLHRWTAGAGGRCEDGGCPGGAGHGRGAGTGVFALLPVIFSPKVLCLSFDFVERAWCCEGLGFSFLASRVRIFRRSSSPRFHNVLLPCLLLLCFMMMKSFVCWEWWAVRIGLSLTEHQ